MGESVIGKLKVLLDFDGARLEKGLTNAKRSLKAYENAVKTANVVAKSNNFGLKATTTALEGMKALYAGNVKYIDQLRDKLEDAKAKGKGDNVITTLEGNLTRAIAKNVELEDSFKHMRERMLTVNSDFYKFGTSAKNVGHTLVGIGDSISSIGDGFTQIGAVATVGGAIFAKSAIDFERGMVAVKKTTNASASEMRLFESQIREMAKTMPVSTGELQELAATAGQLGVKTKDIAHFTEVMAKVGTATNLTSQQAADSFARFTNITGSGTTTLENLGSALVALGNNFATTESEIMDMAKNMAGSLTAVGVSEDKILGLSTAMSALGIKAERGGTAMSKFFVNMANSVSQGGQSLQQFAQVAGMSADQFAQKFRTDAMGAFQDFINGLAKIKESGGDVIGTLANMGIKESRLRDAILRLVNGHDKLNGALKMSSEEYKKASALDAEYNQQVQSTASQLIIAQNKARDFAISIGQELLPAFIDLMGHTGGLEDTAKNIVSAFQNMSGSTKEAIVKWGGLSLVLGPVISGFGKLTSGIGKGLTTLGEGSIKVANFTAKLKALKQGGIDGSGAILSLSDRLAKVGTDASGAKTAIGHLGTGINKLKGLNAQLSASFTTMAARGGALSPVLTTLSTGFYPLGVAIAATTVAIGAGVAAWKWYHSEAQEAARAAQKFPDISGITGKQADSLRNMSSEFSNLNGIMEATGGASVQYAGEIQSSVGKIATEIKNLNNAKIDDLKNTLSELPGEVQKNVMQAQQASIKESEDQINRAQEISAQISKIYEQARAENRELNQKEIAEVGSLTNELMNIYAKANSDGAEQAKEIYANLCRDLSSLNDQQLAERIRKVDEMIEKENQSYERQREALKKLHESGRIDTSEYERDLAKVEEIHSAHLERMKTAQARAFAEEYERIKKDVNGGEEVAEQALENFLKKTDMTREEFDNIMSRPVEMDGLTTGIAKAFDDATEEAQKSVEKWNAAVGEFADKTGKRLEDLTNDDIKSFIDKIDETGLTWKDLDFVRKNAYIDDNTKDLISDVLFSKEQWESLSFEDKKAVLETIGEDDLQRLCQSLGIDWNEIDPELKKAVIQAEGKEKVEEALRLLGKWDELPMDEKVAILKAQVPSELLSKTIEQMGLWDNQEFVDKFAKIDTNAPDSEQQIAALMAKYGEIPDECVKTLNAQTNAREEVTEKLDEAIQSSKDLGIQDPFVGTGTDAIENVKNLADEASASADNLDSKDPFVETGTDAEGNVTDPENEASSAADVLGSKTPDVQASTNSPDVEAAINRAENAAQDKQFSITGVFNAIGNAVDWIMSHFKTGTPSLSRDMMAVLGDGFRREPFLTPSGVFGVSPATNTLYALPKGTQIWSSINKFQNEAQTRPELQPFLDRLQYYKKGTQTSFLDKITVPKNYNQVMTSSTSNQTEIKGDTYQMNITIDLVGNSISRSQSDSLIEQLMGSAKRYAEKKGGQINFGIH